MITILEKQIKLQREIQLNHGGICPTDFDGGVNKKYVIDYIKDHSFFMSEEVTELMLAVGGNDRAIIKPWSSRHADLSTKIFESTDEVKSEAIDMLCFCLNICLAAGLTPKNIESEYHKVWLKNIKRQNEGY